MAPPPPNGRGKFSVAIRYLLAEVASQRPARNPDVTIRSNPAGTFIKPRVVASQPAASSGDGVYLD
jgi:hypothetical protein